MTLKKYHQKRNFKKTPEPYGKKKSSGKKLLYLIQKHAASHLHYDFRLELDGVLFSWAVPKGPSLDPTVKRLAVHVEDHPIEYGSFQGIIPQGEYGGGTVMLWDTGEWECQDADLGAAYRKGHLTFLLKGKKLHGLWTLIQIKTDPKNWLLIKVADEYARPENDYSITEKMSKSVTTKQTMDQIAQQAGRVWGKSGEAKTKKKIRLTLNVGEKINFPKFIFPELATLVTDAPDGDDWLHEIKLDGYRLLCFLQNGKAKFVTRNQNDWTTKFPNLAQAVKHIPCKNAILDGEIVALDKKQRSDFQLLQNSIYEKDDSELIYFLFDLIYLNDRSLENVVILERKKILQTLIADCDPILHYSDHIIGNGKKVFTKSCRLGLEGIVSKYIDSYYSQKRTRDWLKIKCVQRQEFVIAGYTQPTGARRYFGSLLLGVYAKDKKLHYCGNVGTGFTEKSLASIWQQLKKYTSDNMPFAVRPAGSKNVTWLKPNLVAEIEFSEWTRDGSLRHPSFKGLRTDKPATQIIHEKPAAIEEKSMKPKSSHKKKPSSMPEELSNPERIMYPEQGITKRDLAEYYIAISDWILPYIADRPLTIVRCPQGRKKDCFYQKHLNEAIPQGIFPIPIKEKEGAMSDYFYLKKQTGLLSLVQIGALEIHPWGARVDDVDKPDYMIFDLDPAPDVPWPKVVAHALYVKEQLETLQLKSFVKTTGGKGLHIIIPIKRHYDWDDVKAFSHAIVEWIVTKKPADFIGVMTKSKRTGKIFLDYLRNQRGATAIAPYSTRARENATVATPIAWQELTGKLNPANFTVKTIPARLAKLRKDPWEDFYRSAQSLKALRKFKA